MWLTSRAPGWLSGRLVARTDAAGAFLLPHVPPDQSLGAVADGWAPSELVDLDLLDTDAGAVEVELVLHARGAELTGIVLDADAAPVEGARVIATSPLTKTAVAGRDPNWGRILSAAGRAGVAMDADKARVWIGSTMLFEDGRPFPERERTASQHLCDESEVVLGVDLAAGDAAADVWTCDLTADYVRINADYRT